MTGRAVSVLLAVVVAVLVVVGAGSAAGAAVNCSASFTVLHDDRVGALSIPRGKYFLQPSGLSCAAASSLLTRFLSDFDGSLPDGWATAATGLGFVRAASNASFELQSAPSPGSAGRCPGTFTVEHNDRIGSLRLRAGRYAITPRRLSCAFADRRFAFFLFHDYAGTLPPGWRLNVAQKRFSRGRASFTVRRVGKGATSGGGVHPSLAITCPGTVSLAAGTTFGSLVVPAGAYYVNVFSDLSCASATAQFEQFAASGVVPAHWVVVPETGTFLRGNEGFQIEPVS
ncbi:MAG: hypothetical protein ACXWZ8_06170 [Gaiellaceae bacterium]